MLKPEIAIYLPDMAQEKPINRNYLFNVSLLRSHLVHLLDREHHRLELLPEEHTRGVPDAQGLEHGEAEQDCGDRPVLRWTHTRVKDDGSR